MKDITSLTAWELKEKLDNNELTAEEITNAYADRIKEKEPEVQAFLSYMLLIHFLYIYCLLFLLGFPLMFLFLYFCLFL